MYIINYIFVLTSYIRQIYKKVFKSCLDKLLKPMIFEKICITPIDKDVQLMAQSAKIINDFKRKGFKTRAGFLGVVTDNVGGYLTLQMINKLNTYWAGRVRDAEMNNTLLTVLETLKDE